METTATLKTPAEKKKYDFDFNEENIAFMQRNLASGFKFRLMMLLQLPMGFLCGMRIREINHEQCKVTVPFKWLNKNPFRSTFWAVLGMAAELSSGAMVLMYTYKLKPSISMLVTGTTASYSKKATKTTTFVSKAGNDIASAVRAAMETGEPP